VRALGSAPGSQTVCPSASQHNGPAEPHCKLGGVLLWFSCTTRPPCLRSALPQGNPASHTKIISAHLNQLRPSKRPNGQRLLLISGRPSKADDGTPRKKGGDGSEGSSVRDRADSKSFVRTKMDWQVVKVKLTGRGRANP
jgi:hypothetical protein